MKSIIKWWLLSVIFFTSALIATAQPVINYLGTYNYDGVPNYLEAKRDTLSQDFIDRISEALPEGEPVPSFHPDYLQGGYNMVLEITQLADVWITYVAEGAGYKNVLGFYTYNKGNPPTSESDIDTVHIIFPNVSNSGSGGGLNPGDKVNIGRFPAGKMIGFALFANGWSSSQLKSTYGSWRLYSNNDLNPATNPTQKQQTVILYDPVEEIYVLSFEDIRRDNGGDQDFNDAIFYAESNPVTAIDPGEVPQLSLLWRGGYSTDWFDARNWVPNVVPDSTMTVKIDKNAARNPYINGVAEVGDILIEPFKPITFSEGSKLSIYKSFTSYNEPNNSEFRAGQIEFVGNKNQKIYGNPKFYDLMINKPDGTITIYGNVDIRGTLILENGDLDISDFNLKLASTNGYSGALIPKNGNVITSGTGKMIVERFIPSPTGYHYISSPAEVPLAQLDDDYKLVSLGGNTNTYPFPNLWKYDETDTSSNSEIGWTVPLSMNELMEAGQGFAFALQSGTILDVEESPNNINNGDVSINLNFTPNSNLDTICPPEGWNFIGNPYPSAIDLTKLTLPDGMLNQLHIWDPMAQQYACYVNGISTLGATAIIPAFQGFFVKVDKPTTLTFTNAMRVKDNYINIFNFKNTPKDVFNLVFTGKGKTDEIALYQSPNATFGFDSKLDGLKLPSINADIPQIYWEVQGNGVSINAIPTNDSTVVLPLTVDVKYAGWYKFQKAEMSGFSNYEVTLIDTLEGKRTPITTKPYSFGVDEGKTTNRFYIEFKFIKPQSNPNEALSTNNNFESKHEIKAAIYADRLEITSFIDQPSTIHLFDVMGREVSTINLQANSSYSRDISYLNSGIYLLQYAIGDKQKVVKLLK